MFENMNGDTYYKEEKAFTAGTDEDFPGIFSG